jgi:hypothetical protein
VLEIVLGGAQRIAKIHKPESDKNNKKLSDSLEDCFVNGNCKNTINILLKADKNNCRIAASLIGSFYLHDYLYF